MSYHLRDRKLMNNTKPATMARNAGSKGDIPFTFECFSFHSSLPFVLCILGEPPSSSTSHSLVSSPLVDPWLSSFDLLIIQRDDFFTPSWFIFPCSLTKDGAAKKSLSGTLFIAREHEWSVCPTWEFGPKSPWFIGILTSASCRLRRSITATVASSSPSGLLMLLLVDDEGSDVKVTASSTKSLMILEYRSITLCPTSISECDAYEFCLWTENEWIGLLKWVWCRSTHNIIDIYIGSVHSLNLPLETWSNTKHIRDTNLIGHRECLTCIRYE